MTMDPSDVEDLRAPHGRCRYCRSPFGMPNKDGMIFYEFDRSGVCTGCQDYDDREASRREDDRYNRMVHEGRKSG